MNLLRIFGGVALVVYILFQAKVGVTGPENFMSAVVRIRDSYYEQEDSLPFASVDEREVEVEEIGDDDVLEILAFGDMMLGRYVRTLMDKYGKDYVFENLGELRDLYPEADLVFANLEGPIYGEGVSGGTAMVFGFNEDVGEYLRNIGVDLVSIANNHAVDKGWEGRAETMRVLDESGVGFCGHPSEADPDSVYYGAAGSKTFAFVCFNDISYPLDDEAAIELVHTVSEQVDFTIVSIHWGVEYENRPNWSLQKEPGHALVDAGADFIIGHHPHVVQNFEKYNDRYIFYSLGNFVFDQYWAQGTQEELGLKIAIWEESDELKTTVGLIPMRSEKSQVRLMTDDELTNWLPRFISWGDYDEDTTSMINDLFLSF